MRRWPGGTEPPAVLAQQTLEARLQVPVLDEELLLFLERGEQDVRQRAQRPGDQGQLLRIETHGAEGIQRVQIFALAHRDDGSQQRHALGPGDGHGAAEVHQYDLGGSIGALPEGIVAGMGVAVNLAELDHAAQQGGQERAPDVRPRRHRPAGCTRQRNTAFPGLGQDARGGVFHKHFRHDQPRHPDSVAEPRLALGLVAIVEFARHVLFQGALVALEVEAPLADRTDPRHEAEQSHLRIDGAGNEGILNFYRDLAAVVQRPAVYLPQGSGVLGFVQLGKDLVGRFSQFRLEDGQHLCQRQWLDTAHQVPKGLATLAGRHELAELHGDPAGISELGSEGPARLFADFRGVGLPEVADREADLCRAHAPVENAAGRHRRAQRPLRLSRQAASKPVSGKWLCRAARCRGAK